MCELKFALRSYSAAKIGFSFNALLTHFKIVLTEADSFALYLCQNNSLLNTFNMRYVTTISSLLFILFLFSNQTASAQIQVRIGVPPPSRRVVVVERPPCPGRDYAWIEGHYVYDSYTRRDVWIPGQWEYVQPRYEQRGRGRGHGRGHERRNERDRYYGRN